MAFAEIISNPILWISTTMLFLLMFLMLMIFLIIAAKKTHMVVEIKAWIKGWPIAMFYEESRYCEWKPVNPDAGIITDKHYGAYIINERATYVDKRTKNVLIPFDASFGASVNVHAAKLIDDFQYMYKDEEKMKDLRHGIINNLIDDSESIDVLKTSINFGAIKNMMTALVPHNINAKIEKTIASRMKGMGNINVPQVAMLFAALFGAIILGGIIVKLMFGKGD